MLHFSCCIFHAAVLHLYDNSGVKEIDALKLQVSSHECRTQPWIIVDGFFMTKYQYRIKYCTYPNYFICH